MTAILQLERLAGLESILNMAPIPHILWPGIERRAGASILRAVQFVSSSLC
jgi:hypothetical protein